jgi:hypothetical protein
VLVVAHLTKDESTKLLNRVNGSGAFVNAARSAMALARHPDDPDIENGAERVLVHLRTNWDRLAPSLSARLEEAEIRLEDDTLTTIGRLRITGESGVSVEDLQGRRDDASGNEIEEAIGAALADGPRPSREVKAEVKREMGCGDATVKRAAKRLVERDELIQESGGFPKTTTWRLDAPQSDHSRLNTRPGDPTVELQGFSADSVIPLGQLAHEPEEPVPLTETCDRTRDRMGRETAGMPAAEAFERRPKGDLMMQARAWQEDRKK